MSDGETINNPKKTGAADSIHPRIGGILPSPSAPSKYFTEGMYRGYFPLWRKITDWGWYKNSNTKAVFLHLLLLANFEEKDYLGYKIQIGQCVIGRKKLSADLGLSEMQIRVALKHLKKTKEITSKSYSKFTVITLLNFNKYIPLRRENNQQNNQQVTSKQPASNQQVTTPYKTNKTNKTNKTKYKEKKNLNFFFPFLKNNLFLTTFNDFLEMRRKIKKPATKRAQELILKQLHGYSLETAIKMLERSIVNSWQGVFEIKQREEKNDENKYTGIEQEISQERFWS